MNSTYWQLQYQMARRRINELESMHESISECMYVDEQGDYRVHSDKKDLLQQLIEDIFQDTVEGNE